MSVHCEGDSRVMEQLGEKQDFEVCLTVHAYAHEDFALDLRMAGATRYTVGVTHAATRAATRRRCIYWGGAGRVWVAEFAADLANGVYGPPRKAAANLPVANAPARGERHLRLVSP